MPQGALANQVCVTPAFVSHLEAPNISKAPALDALFDIATVCWRCLLTNFCALRIPDDAPTIHQVDGICPPLHFLRHIFMVIKRAAVFEQHPIC